MRRQGARGGEVGRQAKSQRSQSGWKKRLDGRLFRTSGAGAVASGPGGEPEKLNGEPAATVNKERRAKAARRSSRLLCPKPPLRSFTKAIGLGSSMPSWCSGNTRVLHHRRAFADCFGANPVASALRSSTRRDPGTADRTYHEWSGRPPKTGTFYFARKRNFLLCLDRER